MIVNGDNFPIYEEHAFDLYMYIQTTKLAIKPSYFGLYFALIRLWHKTGSRNKSFGYKHDEVFRFRKYDICQLLKVPSNEFPKYMAAIQALQLWEYNSSGANAFNECTLVFSDLLYEGFSSQQFVHEKLMAIDIDLPPKETKEDEREKIDMKELLADYKVITEDEKLFVVMIIQTMKEIAIEKRISKHKNENYNSFNFGNNSIAAIKIYEIILKKYPNATALDFREIIILWLRDFYEKLLAINKVSYFNPSGIIYQIHLEESQKLKQQSKKNNKYKSKTPKTPKKNAKDPIGNPV